MILPITLTTAAACAVLNLWLALGVANRRIKGKVLIGDGGDAALFARQRAHANFVEYAPFILILIAGIELAGGSALWLQVAAVAFVVARLAHGLGMTRPAPNVLRAGGTAITFALLALLAGWAIAIVYQGPAQTAPGITLAPAKG